MEGRAALTISQAKLMIVNAQMEHTTRSAMLIHTTVTLASVAHLLLQSLLLARVIKN
jgi:hypothetical protein